ncbi:hypothetical protein LA080_013137 [Diaporthe eres]|nr:hypothetical protein LA080_013137 [Diaporthe eres]
MFGIPNLGLENRALISMTDGRKNEMFSRNLGLDSQYLPELNKDFGLAFGQRNLSVIAVYETKDSNTVEKMDDGHERALQFEWCPNIQHAPVATRELIIIYHSLKNERMHRTSQGFKAISELWTHPRTRYAMLASITVMFLQQLCGINVLAYYSTTLIQDTFAKKDLATSLPSKASKVHFFELGESRELTDSLTKSMMMMQVYASECFPLHHRVLGMGLATSVTWIFNFLLAVTWPVFNRDFGKPGAFSCFVRETKGLRLEEMGEVFSPPILVYLDHAFEELKWLAKRLVLWPFQSLSPQCRFAKGMPQLKDNKNCPINGPASRPRQMKSATSVVGWRHIEKSSHIAGITDLYSQATDIEAGKIFLRDANLSIGAGAKVADIGRTGKLDGRQLRCINRHTVQDRIIVGFQDMMFLAGGKNTHKSLSDPENQLTDECQAALAKAEDIEHEFGQGTEQRPLGGIVILDELTSSVDAETENLMHSHFSVFCHYILIRITHRLESLAEYDAVDVVSQGQIIKPQDATSGLL